MISPSSDASSREQPFVSVIMPVRDEEKFIGACLGSVLAQDYPRDRMEVVVADGLSTDGTRAVVEAIMREHANVRLVDNVGKIASTGLNVAIAHARGDFVIRVDGHCEVAPDFVRQNVAVFAEHPDAWSVGGPIEHRATGTVGKAIAIAMSHRLGVGGANQRFSGYEGYAENVQFPGFRAWVFDRIGNFDENLVRNQDDDLSFRILQAGGKTFISPRIRYTYYVRESLLRLYSQYMQYGFWRVPVIRKHGRPTTLRQIVPALFYVAVAGMFLLGCALGQPRVAFALPVVYAVMLMLAGLGVAPRAGLSVAVRVPVAIALLHAGYGFGFLRGLWVNATKRS